MSLTREQKALTVYLKLLEGKGVGAGSIARHEKFLNKLMPLLGDVANNGAQYREALDLLMDSLPSSDWPYGLAVAREYYTFWMGDIKAIAAYNAMPGFEEVPISWQPIEASLKVLWDVVDNSKFDLAESWALKAYTKALRDENAPQALIDTRVKLVKVLLNQLKDAPIKHNQAYRVSVDATVPLFEVKQTRQLFLAVVREFFHFWSGNPDAASFILKDTNQVNSNSGTFD